jgi:uridine monophosphate synthetase
MNLQTLVLSLFDIGAIRFGDYLLKSGIRSPIYVDLRLTVSYPKLLILIGEALYTKMRGLHFDLICGVPYTALPFATAISIAHNLPMVFRRKEKKDYGTAQTIEGVYQKGNRCLIIEDIITSGTSIRETAKALRDVDLQVKDATVLIDREQGGAKALLHEGIEVHSVLTLSQCLAFLLSEKKVTEETVEQVRTFLASHQV